MIFSSFLMRKAKAMEMKITRPIPKKIAYERAAKRRKHDAGIDGWRT